MNQRRQKLEVGINGKAPWTPTTDAFVFCLNIAVIPTMQAVDWTSDATPGVNYD
jgi:hypothetical protein